jgi:hypothetical protein
MAPHRSPRRATLVLAASLVCAAGTPSRAWAEDDDPLAGLSGEKALAYAKELAVDGMRGRKSGGPGGRMAEEWAQSLMGRLGLDPMDREGIYLQAFRFPATDVVAPIGLTVEGEPVAYRTDFVDLLFSGDGVAEAEVVFVGYGISAPDRAWDDYAGVDVSGKVVLAIRGAPARREAEFFEERQIGWKSRLAASRGAAGFLVADGRTPVPGTIQGEFFAPRLPAAWVSAEVADRLLGKHGRTLAELRRARDEGDPGRSFGTGAKVRLEVHGRFAPQAEGRNALGGIPGRDPDLRNEVILVGAHLDHLGVDPTGQVFNGANDNASGVAAILALAETLKENRWRGDRTVVFACFAGEEQGLSGAKALVADVPFPFPRIVAMLNVDMAGHGKTEVSFGGGEAYPAMAGRILRSLQGATRARLRSFRADKNSDHWPFYERGIPSFFVLSSGEYAHYHQPTDDAERLNPEAMEAVARVVGEAVVRLAAGPEPLATGREVPGYLLREGARVVAGARSAALLDARFSGATPPAGGGRTESADAGWACVVLPLSEAEAGGVPVAWARLLDGLRAAGRDWALARTASDVANSARGARTTVLPRLACPASVARRPSVLAVYREMGVRWVDPFEPGKPPSAAERDAVLAAAGLARVVVDLTALPEADRAAARARLGDAPATVRTEDAAGLAALRRALGPRTLVLVSGPAADAVLSPAALAAQDDPALSPVCVVDDDTERLTDLLVPAAASDDLSLAEPASPARARVRALLGGAFVDLLRRLP